MPGLSTYLERRLAAAPEASLLHGNRACARPHWTARELLEAVDSFAAGLHTLGVGHGDHVGLVADNHDLWLVADLACLRLGAVDVPRAGDTPAEEVRFVLQHGDCRFLIVEDGEILERLLDGGEPGPFQGIVVLKGEAAAPATTFEEVCTRGRRALGDDAGLVTRMAEAVDEDDLATVVYTSGTTGNPKGVMLTHGNILHNVRVLPEMVDFSAADRYLSFLPTWHTFERTLEYSLLAACTPLHYSSKSSLRKDFVRVRPTVVAAVPRLWETMVGAVTGKLAKESPVKQRVAGALLDFSRRFAEEVRQIRRLRLDAGFRVVRPSLARRLLAYGLIALAWPFHRLADRLVYSKLRAALGGEIRFVVSGGGALPEHVDEFIARAGVCLIVGYGLTETSPVICLRDPQRNILTTSGRPLPETSWRVMDEAGERDLGRGVKGVLWLRGPQVMRGYFRNDEATRAVLSDGWFCSGDLAALSDEDDVVICGRAKDTIVLRGGENIEPELIEARLMESPFIADVVVVGHGEKHLGALVVPDADGLAARVPGLGHGDLMRVAQDTEVARLLHGEVGRRLSTLRVFERVPRIACLPAGFTVEDGTLTPTLKKRRNVIEARFAGTIASLFGEGSPEAAPGSRNDGV